jgi:hypothetical protein
VNIESSTCQRIHDAAEDAGVRMSCVCDQPTDRSELAILDAQTPIVPSVQIKSGAIRGPMCQTRASGTNPAPDGALGITIRAKPSGLGEAISPPATSAVTTTTIITDRKKT